MIQSIVAVFSLFIRQTINEQKNKILKIKVRITINYAVRFV